MGTWKDRPYKGRMEYPKKTEQCIESGFPPFYRFNISLFHHSGPLVSVSEVKKSVLFNAAPTESGKWRASSEIGI